MKTYYCLFLILLLTACQNNPNSGEETDKTGTEEAAVEDPPVARKKKIIFFGNSLTAAFGLDPSQGFTTLIQQKLDALNLPYEVVNAGLSGETTSGGNERVDWVLEQGVDIFLLELGGNDGLRGIDPKVSYQNLAAIIEKVKKSAPDAVLILAGMHAPPNMGKMYTDEFSGMYPRLAKQYNLPLIPFLLENVGGIPELNLPDGIHPNEEGQKIVAENVWKVLKDEL